MLKHWLAQGAGSELLAAVLKSCLMHRKKVEATQDKMLELKTLAKKNTMANPNPMEPGVIRYQTQLLSFGSLV